MSGDGAYAPKSPDLSTLYSTPAPAQAPSSVPPTIPSPAGGPAYQQHHTQPYHAPRDSPIHHQQHPQQVTSQQYGSHQQLTPNPTSYHTQSPQGGYFPPRTSSDPHRAHYSPPGPRKQQDSPQDTAQQSSFLPPQSPARHQTYQQHNEQYFPQNYGQVFNQPYPPSQQQLPLQHPYATQPALSLQTDSYTTGRADVKAEFKSEEDIHTMPPKIKAEAIEAVAATPIEPSPVRTKFPTARIKRIMQADDEVGKVAQQTPIAVGKALEMFMVELVRKSADVAKEKSSRRVTAQMLKQVIESDQQWDWLQDIVSKVEPEKEGSKASKVKAETDSDEDAEPKKKGRGGRKKKTG